ncbi:MAG: Glycosyl transferase group 1 [Candidatus Kaiserbacteria bacterium GW2011_GWA2_58_9]|nr:MAG: Glycosyl transferase group 1 [Candidatus Kaiserbacteria bacterium GW2011_GWA2_58_9]
MSYAMDNRQAKGTALYTRKLIEHLVQDKRFDVYLVHYNRADDPLYKKAREIIMPEIRLPFGTRFVRQLLFFWKYRKEPFDIIHWFQPRLYPFFWLAPARVLVATLHGAADVTGGGRFPFSRRMFNFVLKHFSHRLSAIIADSEFGRAEIVEWYRAKEERVHVIYLGGGQGFVPIDKKTAKRRLKEQYGIEGDFILDISLHVRHKNIISLVRAYIELQKQEKTLLKLVIVGAKEYAYHETFVASRLSPRPDDIIFIDFISQEDLNAIYSAAAIFVFPSLNEGFGLPIIEAFASGTPVVTSNITSMPEIAGDAALLADPSSDADIAEKISLLLSDGQFCNGLIKKGLERAKDFSWRTTAEKTARIYLDLLKT